MDIIDVPKLVILNIYTPLLKYIILMPGQTTSMRQTNVVVVPSCSVLSEFKTFDTIVRAINVARRSARDFNFKKDESDNKNWV